MSSRVLGIDPGYTRSGWLMLQASRPVESGMEGNAALLAMLRAGAMPCDFLALEMVASYGMPVGREVFDTVLWIGRFHEAASLNGMDVRLIYRREVKLHLCGSAKANDATIRQALIDRFGPGKNAAIGKKKTPGPLYGISGDVWSALAIAVTAQDRDRLAPSAASD